jgi:hypothetical protein
MPPLVRVKRAAIAAALAAGLAAPVAATASSALRPLWLKRSSYGESFTFIADLDDGTYVQLSLSLTNLGPGPTKGLCRALVVRAAGAPWKASTRVGRDSCSWSDGEGERLAIGPCSAWIDAGGTGVEVPLDGGAVRLAFAARPGRRAGRETAVTIGGERYDTEVLLHHVPVSATLALPGERERRLAGGGYLDHTRSTISPVSLAERWVRFRALRGDRALLVLGRHGHDGRFTPLWACEGPACREYTGFKVERDGAGHAPAFRVEVAGADDPLDIRSARLLYRDAPIEDLGVLGKLVMPFTGNPVTYVYRARASDVAGAPVDGILEVEVASE